MPKADAFSANCARRDRLEKLLRSFDARIPSAFAQAVQSFLTAYDYQDVALMRSHLVAVREAMLDTASGAIQKRLEFARAIRESYEDALAVFEDGPVEAGLVDELGREIVETIDSLLPAMTELEDGVVTIFQQHKIEVPNAGELRAEIAALIAIRSTVCDTWPRLDQLPPVDRNMIAESRASFDRGEGEPIDELIRRLGGDPARD
jgi:hypothetical protein